MSIYPRTNYEMTEADLKELMDAFRPEPVMKIGDHWTGQDQQERANAAWKRLGDKMGFDHMTVQPGRGGNRFFSAVPSETDEQRQERCKNEILAAEEQEVERLRAEIDERQQRLSVLRPKLFP